MYNDDDSNTLTEGIAGSAEEKEFIPAYGSEWKDKRFNLQHGYSFWLSAVPIKMFSGCGLPSSLGFSDCGKLYRCAMLMQQHTNMLFYHSHGVDKPLTVEKLADRLGVNVKYCYSFIQRMVDLRIMAREDGRIYMNPIYFFRGRHLSWHLYQLFETDLESVLPQWVVDRYNGDIHA